MSAMWRATLGGRCPACGVGGMFAGWLRLRDACEVCNVQFDRHEGNWLGPAVLAYGIAATVAFAAGVLLVSRHGFFHGLATVLVSAAVVTALVVYRPVKAWWIWLLWRTGMVVTDDEAGPDRG